MRRTLYKRAWKIHFLFLLVLFIALFTLFSPPESKGSDSVPPTRDIHLFTIEYQSLTSEGKKEVYRFEPGSIVVHQGEQIRLHLHGFHGKEHFFSIPAFGVKGKVNKGEMTTINFLADKLGTFELICHNHASTKSEGPMIAYITVIK